MLLSLGCIGCAHRAPPPPTERPTEADYPGSLVPSERLPDGLFYEQRIEARHELGEVSFWAVLQTRDGVLALLGLTPYGTRAFLLEQRGTSHHFTAYIDRPLPFPSRYILLDVHRTFFLGLPPPAGDGRFQGVIDGDRVTEVWRDGRLRERSFVRVEGKPPGTIRIRYIGGMRPGVPPPRIEFDNGWFGYKLTIRTLTR